MARVVEYYGEGDGVGEGREWARRGSSYSLFLPTPSTSGGKMSGSERMSWSWRGKREEVEEEEGE